MYDPSLPLLRLTSAAAVMCVKAIPQTEQPVDILAADLKPVLPWDDSEIPSARQTECLLAFKNKACAWSSWQDRVR